MKLISKEAAIAAIQVVPDEVRPLAGHNIPGVVAAVTQRYQFARTPTLEEVNKVGARFLNGTFAGNKIIITELGIFSNSVSVTTTDTSDSQTVLDDLVSWLQNEFGFRDPQTKPVLAFQSDV